MGAKGSGARRKPTNLKIIQGTERPDRKNPDEPMPEVTIPDPPEGLSAKQVEYYHDFAKKIYGMNIMTEVDHYAIASLARYWDTWMEASQFIDEYGATYEAETRFGTIYKRYPEWSVAQQAFQNVHKLLCEFGLTPASRSKVSVTTKGGAGKKRGDAGWKDL